EVRELALESVLRKLHEEEGDEAKRRPLWLSETTVADLTNMAVHERHQQCLAKVLQVLCVLGSSSELLWKDGAKTLSQEEVLIHLLTLAENFTHSVELLCAAVTLASQLVVALVSSDHQDPGAVVCFAQWGALVRSCSAEDQPVEVKLMVAKVLVTCSSTLMTNPQLPLGLAATVSLWSSLFTLLQDEDQEVRDAASDFTCCVPAHLLSSDQSLYVAGVFLCPPAALDLGVGLLCEMFDLWGQLGAGLLALTQWLMGEEDDGDEDEAEEASCLDEEDFLFEKGELNLWAEPLQWVQLLHRHLRSLLARLGQNQAVNPDQVGRIQTQARAKLLASQQALDRLPALPQFCCSVALARLTL
uniref:THADA armadillo repeat containing n=1 Tax=Poecilia formosa TaxID=48698 RepID=A0A096M256_POEFO